jgi:TDG/mug DNA glycosylase family protein
VETPWRPTKDQLIAANGRSLPDLIKPKLNVLFCGINPGLYSAAVGHHFARPGNRFWAALHASGFTPRVFSPFEEHELLTLGLGVTNVVARATAGADELRRDELVAGAKKLVAKLKRHQPRYLAVLGLGAYRVAFGQADAKVGPQKLVIGSTRLWVLPNPSGLNAHYQPRDLAREFAKLRREVEDAQHRLH